MVRGGRVSHPVEGRCELFVPYVKRSSTRVVNFRIDECSGLGHGHARATRFPCLCCRCIIADAGAHGGHDTIKGYLQKDLNPSFGWSSLICCYSLFYHRYTLTT